MPPKKEEIDGQPAGHGPWGRRTPAAGVALIPEGSVVQAGVVNITSPPPASKAVALEGNFRRDAEPGDGSAVVGSSAGPDSEDLPTVPP